MHVAGTLTAPFEVTHVVEQVRRVVAGAAEVAVVGRVFLVAIDRADTGIHVEDDHLWRMAAVDLSILSPDRSARAIMLSSGARNSVSKYPVWLADAAFLVTA